MSVPFFDRTRGDAALEGELVEAFQRVLRSGRFILGREVERFEAACAECLQVRHAVGVSSGSDALLAALMALGVGPGDEILCPAYSFFATAGAVARLGATPIFADVDPATYLLDPASAAAQLSPRTRAIVPVHLFGRAVDLTALAALTAVPIIEDAAQAFGAAHRGRPVGSIGAMGCFSFFPTKNLGGFGDGGLVTTGDDAIADRLRALRAHGAREKGRHALLGGNFRLDALQAALLAVKLVHVDPAIAARAEHARRYRRLFDEVALGERIALAPESDGATWNQLVIRVHGEGERDRLRAFLSERGIGTEIYYPLPLHLQPCFASLGHREGSFPVAEAAARETLALPIFPELTAAEIDQVVTQIAAFVRR